MPVGSETLKFGIKQVDKSQVLALKIQRSCRFERYPLVKANDEGLYRHRNDPHHRNDLRHRNDTGSHYQNDPRNIGNGIKRTTKTGQQFSACFLSIYIAFFFLRCVIYLYRTLFCCKLFLFFSGGGGGGFNTRLYLFKRCNSLMSSISSNFFFLFFYFWKKTQGCVRYYGDDQTVCDLCQYMETHPDVME